MFRTVLPTDRPVTRRALVVTIPGTALVLSGCDLDPRAGDDDPAAPQARPDPDLAALSDTVLATDAAAALVAATTAAHPALLTRLAGLGALHTAHRAALDGAAASMPEPSTSPTPTAVPDGQAQALAAVRRAEGTLATRLAGRAHRAESGTFARLLAVMSAAVQQELLVLDRAGARR